MTRQFLLQCIHSSIAKASWGTAVLEQENAQFKPRNKTYHDSLDHCWIDGRQGKGSLQHPFSAAKQVGWGSCWKIGNQWKQKRFHDVCWLKRQHVCLLSDVYWTQAWIHTVFRHLSLLALKNFAWNRFNRDLMCKQWSFLWVIDMMKSFLRNFLPLKCWVFPKINELVHWFCFYPKM